MADAGTRGLTSRRGRRLAGRAAFLLVSLVSVYVLLPSVLEVFTSWRDLFDLAPTWVAASLGAEALSFVAIWELQRLALGSADRPPVALSQLAGNALGRVIPGGGAVAATLQFRMLRRAGFAGTRVASALAGSSLLLLAAVLALPLLSIPAVLVGASVEPGLVQAALLGGGVFVVMVAAGAAAFVWDRPLLVAGSVAELGLNRTVRRRRRVEGLPVRLLGERDFLRTAFGARWRAAVCAAAGRWIFDYLALLACLHAVGAEPSPSLVLLAFVAGALLGMIPLTPGGLGFVEAGLTGTLALAGVGAAPAAVATLAYRLISFWLPIPAGAVAFAFFRHRYRGRSDRGSAE